MGPFTVDAKYAVNFRVEPRCVPRDDCHASI